MKPLIDKLSKIIEPGSKTKASFNTEFKFLRNMFNQHTYCSYPGSLTTFPFSECVTWLIHTEPFDISSKQVSNRIKLTCWYSWKKNIPFSEYINSHSPISVFIISCKNSESYEEKMATFWNLPFVLCKISLVDLY